MTFDVDITLDDNLALAAFNWAYKKWASDKNIWMAYSDENKVTFSFVNPEYYTEFILIWG